ncbi:outer membrane lipoprotein carrier protein LolA [bacterium]|nr:outer membrane lipoprotein carrier protein LolA [bacterium]
MFRSAIMYCVIAALVLAVAKPIKAGDEEKKHVMKSMKSANETTTTLQAKMKQRKISSFMEKEVVSKADFFYMKPGKYVLDPSSNDENQYIINNNEIWIVNHKNRSVTVTNEKELNFSQYIMGFGGSLDGLDNTFDIKVSAKEVQKKFGSYRMQMTPLKNSKLYNKLEKIVIYVRDDLWLPYGAELYENDGDITIWEFTDLKVNGKIKDDVFKQEMPKGYQLKKYENK